MTAPLLTVEQAATVRAGGRVLIVPGDDTSDHKATRTNVIVDGEPAVRRTLRESWGAPQGWVDCDQPCDTCGDTGVAHPHASVGCGGPCQHLCPNALCRGGRRLHELRTECQECGGSCWLWEPMKRWDDPGREPCGACNQTGSVLVAMATVRVVPVLHWSDNDEQAPACISTGHKSPPGANSYLCLQRFGGHPLNFDPEPVPGRDWGIILDHLELAS